LVGVGWRRVRLQAPSWGGLAEVGWGWVGPEVGLWRVGRVPCGGGFGPGYPVKVGCQGTLRVGRREKVPWG